MSYNTSPILDMLIRIKNAYMANKKEVDWIVFSSFKEKVLSLLKRYNFISDYKTIEEDKKKFIKIYLKDVKDFNQDVPEIKIYSKPSRRHYVWKSELQKVAGGMWIWIVSTNKWVMATHEAYKNNVWWELIAEIY